jgi:regulator of sigma E protease
MLTAISFIVAIGILVAVHELGHFCVAIACNVKVLRFSVGFGPKLFGWISPSSGTEYQLALLPLGGYIKMLDEREGVVPQELKNRAFNTQPLLRKALIVIAGPLANLLLAVVLYSCVNWFGVQQAQAILSKPTPGSLAERAGVLGGETVSSVGFEGGPQVAIVSFDDFRWWITRGALQHRNIEAVISGNTVQFNLEDFDTQHADASMFRRIGVTAPYSPALIGDVLAQGAAEKSGLLRGDRVLSVDQIVIVDAAQLREMIRLSGQTGSAIVQRWLIERSGARLVIPVAPLVEQDAGVSVGRIGAYIGVDPAMVLVRYGAIDGTARALSRTWEVSVLTLKMMGSILTGNASLKNLSGPITIADYAGKSASMGLTQFAIFLALISISLGVLNLLPLPVLDGGHLMYYLWESLSGKPVPELWLERLQRLGLGVLMVMMSVAVFNDVLRLVG